MKTEKPEFAKLMQSKTANWTICPANVKISEPINTQAEILETLFQRLPQPKEVRNLVLRKREVDFDYCYFRLRVTYSLTVWVLKPDGTKSLHPDLTLILQN